MLGELKGKRLRVFAVWEPVLVTDLAPPTTGVLSRLSDPRAVQYWDRSRVLSSLLVRTALQQWRGFPGVGELKEDSVVWDCVLVFSPGQRWEQDPPRPEFADCPVVRVIDSVRRHLEAVPGS